MIVLQTNSNSTVGLFFSVDIMVFYFLHFVFFRVQYIHYGWKHYIKDYIEISVYFVMEVIDRKENMEVATICFEVRILMKKTKIFMEFFHISFQQ